MAQYRTPGVYVEEVSTGARPIAAVGTSTVAFLGVTPDARAHAGTPRAVLNWSQFVSDFCGDAPSSNDMAKALNGFYQNGGGRCYVVNLGNPDKLAEGLAALAAFDEVAIVCAPGMADAATYDAVLGHCTNLGDRVAILDFPAGADDIDALTQVATESGEGAKGGGLRPPVSDGGYGAVYYPHLVVRDPFNPGQTTTAAPSGHMAGIYARTDARRGVHKAPANETVRGALGVQRMITRDEQGILNDAGVNVIRFFPSSGVRVWGARTLADSSSEWRYVNVRRLVNMIKESIENGTSWTVFEPNDMTLWKSVERNVRAFLTELWRQGALMGETPEAAFFVRCDAETNPQASIDAGRLITEIGIAPVKPAEFIVFRLGMQTSEAEG
jgi:phage tail sheath protein FI